MSSLRKTKYTVVGFVGADQPLLKFAEDRWPLHITLLDTFRTEWPQEKLVKELGTMAKNEAPFTMTPISKSLLGPNKDVPVALLQLDDALVSFHNKLLQLADRGSFIYNTPEFVGAGFVPHITDQDDECAELNKLVLLISISLVDMIPDGDNSIRQIIRTFLL